MKKSLNPIFLVVVIIVVLLIGFFLKTVLIKNTLKPPQSRTKIQVAASFYPLYFFATEIGKDRAEVINITPAGSEPHDFEPTTQDIAKIEKSNLLILNGELEAWASKIKDDLKDKNVTIVVAAEQLLAQNLIEEGKTFKDPHVWLSAQLAKKEVENIAKGFKKVDPDNASYYEANAKNLKDKLDQLDTQYREGLKNCRQKSIVTSHAAFGYLASTYGLNQVSIAGLSPDSEPSAQQLAQIAKFAKSNNIKYIFFESLINAKLSQTIASEIGAKTLVLDPLEGLTDQDIKQGKNYFTVMQENLTNLETALECSQ